MVNTALQKALWQISVQASPFPQAGDKGKRPSSGKMTLNASWIERLTLRGQVIRETKGQAKQQENTPPTTATNEPPPLPPKAES